MPRKKEFDEGEVLRKAMELFWVRGYAQTSIADLTDHLGIGRQSLYATFGDKDSLYLAALGHYLDAVAARIERALAQPGPVRDVMRNLLEGAATRHCEDARGCLCANAMIERAPVDARARALTRAHGRRLEELLTRRLAAAQSVGEIPADRAVVALGRFFHGTLLGLAVSGRAFADPAELRDQIDTALRLLD